MLLQEKMMAIGESIKSFVSLFLHENWLNIKMDKVINKNYGSSIKQSKDFKTPINVMKVQAELLDLYEWVDSIPLSRIKKNIARDFADGVLLAEVIMKFFPSFVNLRNYDQAFSKANKKVNWNHINVRVLKKFGISLSEETITELIESKSGAIERVLFALKSKMEELRPELKDRVYPCIRDSLIEKSYKIKKPASKKVKVVKGNKDLKKKCPDELPQGTKSKFIRKTKNMTKKNNKTSELLESSSSKLSQTETILMDQLLNENRMEDHVILQKNKKASASGLRRLMHDATMDIDGVYLTPSSSVRLLKEQNHETKKEGSKKANSSALKKKGYGLEACESGYVSKSSIILEELGELLRNAVEQVSLTDSCPFKDTEPQKFEVSPEAKDERPITEFCMNRIDDLLYHESDVISLEKNSVSEDSFWNFNNAPTSPSISAKDITTSTKSGMLHNDCLMDQTYEHIYSTSQHVQVLPIPREVVGQTLADVYGADMLHEFREDRLLSLIRQQTSPQRMAPIEVKEMKEFYTKMTAFL